MYRSECNNPMTMREKIHIKVEQVGARTHFSSVHFSRSVMSNSLWSHGLQHSRPPCPSPIPGIYPSSCPLSQWCHPTISSSAVPCTHLQSFPASGSFPLSQFFAWGDQNIGVSASASVFPVNTQDWSPSGWTLFALQGTLKSLLQHHSSKASILRRSAFFIVQLLYPFSSHMLAK